MSDTQLNETGESRMRNGGYCWNGKPEKVHNHGSEDGLGLACRELKINGQLVGECMAPRCEYCGEIQGDVHACRAWSDQ